MRNSVIAVTLAAVLLAAAAIAGAETAIVGTATADAAGSGAFDLLVDPKADPAFVAEELRSSLQLSSGARVDSVTMENGVAHVVFSGAPVGSTVEAILPVHVASGIGVGPSPVEIERRRRAGWLWWGSGVAAVGGLLGGLAATTGDGGDGGGEAAPLSPVE